MLINKRDFTHAIKFTMFGIVIFAIHYLLYNYVFPKSLYAPGIFYAHPFNLIVSLVSITALLIIFKKIKQSMIGYAYLFSILVKMFLAIGFLYPVIREDSLFRKEYVLQFFMIYFIYLGMEVFYLVRRFKSQ
jgi:hypothetical protein